MGLASTLLMRGRPGNTQVDSTFSGGAPSRGPHRDLRVARLFSDERRYVSHAYEHPAADPLRRKATRSDKLPRRRPTHTECASSVLHRDSNGWNGLALSQFARVKKLGAWCLAPRVGSTTR